MAQPFRIKFQAPDGTESWASGQIPDSDWQTLIAFKREAEAMTETLKHCESLNVSFTVKFNRMEISSECKVPNDRDLALILHRIRPFVLNDELLNFGRTINLLKRSVRHPLMERSLRTIQELFSGKDFQRQSLISSGDLIVNSEQALQHWLNSEQYHRNPQRGAILQDPDSRFPPEVARAIFIAMMLDKVKAIAGLKNVITAFERGGGSQLKIPLSAPRS